MAEQEQVSALENSSKESTNRISLGQAEKASTVESHQVAESPWWKPLVEFACHIIVGTAIFVFIATPAVALDSILKWLADLKISSFILDVLTLAKKAVFIVDVGL